MKLTVSRAPRQQIFHLQSKVLSSLDRRDAERALRVFDQAWVYRLWSLIPMLPTMPEQGWRRIKELNRRQQIQNTYQTAAFAFDIGVPRVDLARRFTTFQQFRSCSLEATRLFDPRIGPPWWISNREFLQAMYVAVQTQEEPADEWTMSCLDWEEGPVPQWEAESTLDHDHANQADIIGQCESHYYETARRDEEGNVLVEERRKLRSGKDKVEAELSMLLNWQAMWQPYFTVTNRDQPESYRSTSAYPHRAEMRRLLRILNTKPRGRPQR